MAVQLEALSGIEVERSVRASSRAMGDIKAVLSTGRAANSNAPKTRIKLAIVLGSLDTFSASRRDPTPGRCTPMRILIALRIRKSVSFVIPCRSNRHKGEHDEKS